MAINDDERWERQCKSYRDKLVLRIGSETKKKAINYLLPGYLIRGKLNVLAGEFGAGKSMISAAMGARVTQGGSHSSWPGSTPNREGNVLIISTEDEFDDTICPRLNAAGANMSRVAHIDGIQTMSGDVRSFDFSAELDIKILCDMTEDVGNVDLLIIDPIGQTISGDAKNNSKAQKAFEQLGKLAKRLNCAILGITHVSKTTKGKAPLSRIAGPQAISGVPRSVMLTAKIESKTEDGFDCVLVQAKTSLCKTEGGFSYRIESVKIEDDDGIFETSKIVWGDPIYGDPMKLLQEADDGEGTAKPSAIGKAIDFLNDVLANGPMLSNDVSNKASELGISSSTLVRARKELGVISQKKKGSGQFSHFEWSLPVEKFE